MKYIVGIFIITWICLGIYTNDWLLIIAVLSSAFIISFDEMYDNKKAERKRKVIQNE